jgi:hypothetical protein
LAGEELLSGWEILVGMGIVVGTGILVGRMPRGINSAGDEVPARIGVEFRLGHEEGV